MQGVIYLGHLPKGFEEQEIREYFTQFGSVKRVKVGRSMKVLAPLVMFLSRYRECHVLAHTIAV